jgi:DNA-binding NtrC family response regulator
MPEKQKSEEKMMGGAHILVIDNEKGLCKMLEAILTDSGYRVSAFTEPRKALDFFHPGHFQMVITDVKMPDIDGLEVLKCIKRKDDEIPVIMITGYATVEMSIHALRNGAFDILTKPFEPEELMQRVRNGLRQTLLLEENKQLRQELAEQDRFGEVIGKSPALLTVLDTARKIAHRDIPVTISGESGTGKELVACAIHEHSARKGKPFVAINCGALPESLLESELFGHAKGAFTGADQEKKGLFEMADKGTLLLDEVGNLPMNVQKALLRFLQEKEFYRVGETKPTKVDVRVLAATNADLQEEMAAGNFREDLYYRLAVVRIKIPPLRERRTDIPLLAAHFVEVMNRRFGTKVKGFTPEACEVMIGYDWPGNVRELKNVIEATLAIESESLVGIEGLSRLMDIERYRKLNNQSNKQSIELQKYSDALNSFEQNYFTALLQRFQNNIEMAAEKADVNIATLYRKIKKFNLRSLVSKR